MVKCGNCKQSHSTAKEVRNCYREDGKTLLPHERPMTAKQSEYIDVLLDTLEERDFLTDEVAGIMMFFESTYPDPTSGQASNLIEILSNLRWIIPQPVEEQEQDDTEAPDTIEGLCPRCGAAGDEPCTTKNNTEASTPHVGRYTKAS